MEPLRMTLSAAAAFVCLLLVGVTLTVPMVEATAPAVMAIALAFVAWKLWPRP